MFPLRGSYDGDEVLIVGAYVEVLGLTERVLVVDSMGSMSWVPIVDVTVYSLASPNWATVPGASAAPDWPWGVLP